MTTPTGKLMWGQAGAYDGIDDRRVIAAVTGNRTGPIAPVTITVGSGLNMTLKGGWLGLVNCGDGTSAVVGTTQDQVVTGLAGPGSGGARTDYIWCDVQPDLATWTLSVINASAAAGRTGIPLATLTVPQSATQASQFTIVPTDSPPERRLLASTGTSDTATRTATSWAAAVTIITAVATVQPGRYYRVRLITDSFMALSAAATAARGGIGYRVAGAADATSTLMRSTCLDLSDINYPAGLTVEYLFRHPVGSAAVARNFDGRFWVGGGSYKTSGRTDGGAIALAERRGSGLVSVATGPIVLGAAGGLHGEDRPGGDHCAGGRADGRGAAGGDGGRGGCAGHCDRPGLAGRGRLRGRHDRGGGLQSGGDRAGRSGRGVGADG